MRLQTTLLTMALSTLIASCVGSEDEYETEQLKDHEVASEGLALQSGAQAKGKHKVLYEHRHSKTRVTRFLEVLDEVIVETEGSIAEDGMPTNDELAGKPLEIFARFNKGAPPAALVAAVEKSEKIARDLDEARAGKRSMRDKVPADGVRPPAAAAAQFVEQRRELNASSWWRTTACNFAGYPHTGYPDIAYKGCWDSPMRFVNSGDLGNSDHWQAMYAGWDSDATYKHWVLSCHQVFFNDTVCDWNSETGTVAKGYYKTWNASNLRERAGELSTPNNNSGSGLFSLKADTYP